MNLIVTDNRFATPKYIPELEEDGLTSREIAMSLNIPLKHVHQKIQRSFLDYCKDIKDWRVVTNVAINKTNGLPFESYSLNVRSAKAFVATYNNAIGRAYLNRLFDYEQIAIEQIPLLKRQLKELETQQRRLIPQIKKEHGNKNTVLVPVQISTLYGDDVVYRRVQRTDNRHTQLSYKEGELKRLSQLAEGMTKRINQMAHDIALERRR